MGRGELTERDRGEYLGDVPHVSEDMGVSDEDRESAENLVRTFLICLAAWAVMAALIWLATTTAAVTP